MKIIGKEAGQKMPVHMRAARETVQQEQGRFFRRTGLAVKDLHAIYLYLAVAGGGFGFDRIGTSGI